MTIIIDYDKIEFEGQFIKKPTSMSCSKWKKFWELSGSLYTESYINKIKEENETFYLEFEFLQAECETLESEKKMLEDHVKDLYNEINDLKNTIEELRNVVFMYESVSK